MQHGEDATHVALCPDLRFNDHAGRPMWHRQDWGTNSSLPRMTEADHVVSMAMFTRRLGEQMLRV